MGGVEWLKQNQKLVNVLDLFSFWYKKDVGTGKIKIPEGLIKQRRQNFLKKQTKHELLEGRAFQVLEIRHKCFKGHNDKNGDGKVKK